MMMFRLFFFRAARCLLLSAAALSLAACAYKIEIRQGNDLLPQNIEKLQPGMSKDEVSALLGRSLTPHVFRDDIWLYTYQLRDSGFIGTTNLIAVELVFEDDKLAEINRLKDDYETEADETEETDAKEEEEGFLPSFRFFDDKTDEGEADEAETKAVKADRTEESEAEAEGTEEVEGEEEEGFLRFFRFFGDKEDDTEAEEAEQDESEAESKS